MKPDGVGAQHRTRRNMPDAIAAPGRELAASVATAPVRKLRRPGGRLRDCTPLRMGLASSCE